MSLYTIVFSPTGGTKKVADILADTLAGEKTEIDLLKNQSEMQPVILNASDICVIAVPSYGGRVPEIALNRMRNIKGNGAKAILTVAYGNRHIDDTLMELYDTAVFSGFSCIAAVEAVTQHSLMPQYGAGRPDEKDVQELQKFAEAIEEALSHPAVDLETKLPGSHTYKAFGGVPLKPQTSDACIKCGFCAKECPTGAIPHVHPSETDPEKCITCMHCVSICPQKARGLDAQLIEAKAEAMKSVCGGRKENKLYL